MPYQVVVPLEIPDDLAKLRLPPGVNHRLTDLLDRQNRGETLEPVEREEAEGLVDLAELLSLLKLRAERFVEKGLGTDG